MTRIQISSLLNQHHRKCRDFISYIVDAKGAILAGFLGQDDAINADYYCYVLQTLRYQIKGRSK
jgi:hypothetical protein